MTVYAEHPLDMVDDVDEPAEGWPSLVEMVTDFWSEWDHPSTPSPQP